MSQQFSPLVSIIIPVYNHEKYLEEALNSVLYQTYSDLEVIIIDDGSQDRSAERIEKWINETSQNKKTGHHFIFIRQEHQGVPVAINKGLSIARGDFLTILNADDIYDIRRIEKLIRRINEEQGELIFSAVQGVGDDGIPLPVGHLWRNKYEYLIHQLTSMPTIGFQLLEGNLSQTAGNLFFTRNIFQLVGEFKNIKLAHDYDFLLRALLITEPIFLNEELYLYRVYKEKPFLKSPGLLENELNEISGEYLFQDLFRAPHNPKAPSHRNWPLAISLLRSKVKMNHGLSPYIIKKNCKENIKSEVKNNHREIQLKKDHKKKQKISLISHELSLTGAPKVVTDLAQALKKKGYIVNVISLFDGPMRKELEDHKIPLYILPKKIAGCMAYSPNRIKRKCCLFLVNCILLFKIHKITIGNTYAVGPIVTWLSLLNPFNRIIWYIHDSSPPSALLKIEKNKKRSDVYQHNPRFERWFGSKNTQEIWQNSGLGGKTMYWSGIPANHSSPKPSQNHLTEILSVGTSSPRKGTHYLIEAFIKGVKEGFISAESRLTIIGFYDDVNAPYEYVSDMILQVAHSGLKDRIRLITNLEPQDLESYYREADLYVQSSIQECLPLALLKAMSMGIPIVTTNVNGCPEAIENDKTGYVCHSRNSTLLLNAILKALHNPEKSRAMGLEAKRIFNEKFCLEKNLEEVLYHLNQTKTNHK